MCSGIPGRRDSSRIHRIPIWISDSLIECALNPNPVSIIEYLQSIRVCVCVMAAGGGGDAGNTAAPMYVGLTVAVVIFVVVVVFVVCLLRRRVPRFIGQFYLYMLRFHLQFIATCDCRQQKLQGALHATIAHETTALLRPT